MRYIVSTLELKKPKEMISYRGSSYHIPIQTPAYLQDNAFIYYVDIDDNTKYTFEESKEFLTAEQLEISLDNNIVRNVLKGASKINNKIDIYSIILGILIGAFVSAIVVYLFMQGKIDTIINSVFTDTPIYPPF